MKSHAGKIPKACDPCRRRKTRCNGERPCQNCHGEPTACSYRTKARIRQRKVPAPPESAASTTTGQTTRQDAIIAAPPPPPDCISGERDTCLDASGHDGVVATDANDSQIYYGPSSNYTLAQHIRRIILHPPSTPTTAASGLATQDVSHVLDVYMQRHLFFGPPQRADVFATPLLDGNIAITDILPRPTATRFLDSFKLATLNLLPFFTCQSLDILLDKMYVGGSDEALTSQRRALLLIVLAIGALSETDTRLAETIFLAAKKENELREDVVSLETIQFSLLVADYQINMGRATSAYVAIGTACRKFFAMGLTMVPNITHSHEAQNEQRRVTVWAAYFIDSWYSIMGGRKRMIAADDITCQHPKDHTLLTGLCQIATFLEEMTDLMRNGKLKPLHDLYKSASNIHSRLRAWAESAGIGSVATGRQRPPSETLCLLTLHNAYFQAVQFIFRPFIVAEYALQSTARETSELWLRHACRNATDAAIDCIVFFRAMFQAMDLQKLRRRDAYFLEISCSLLLLESLRHPSKHANNAIYIDAALAILHKMPADVPVTALTQSTESIAEAVGNFIAHRRTQAVSRPSLFETQSSAADMDPAGSLMRLDAAPVDDYLQASMGIQALDSSDVENESFLSSLTQEELSAMMVHPFDFSMM